MVSGSGSSPRAAGQLRQEISPHAKIRPKVGEASSNAGSRPAPAAGLIPDGSSRQLIAGNASMLLSA